MSTYLIGKQCSIHVRDPLHGKILYYTVKEVIDVTDTHMTFIDKFGKEFSYKMDDILQIQDIMEAGK